MLFEPSIGSVIVTDNAATRREGVGKREKWCEPLMAIAASALCGRKKQFKCESEDNVSRRQSWSPHSDS